MRINHNIQALNAYRNLSQTMNATSKSLEKLSSGLRINKAADDAAGLAISEKMRSQIRGLDMAERNTLDAISLIQTGEGALNEVHSILQRMRELSVQAANGTLEDTDRKAIQSEIDQLSSEVNRIGNSTEFNSKKLLNSQISPEARSVEVADDFAANATTLDPNSIKLNPKSDLVPSDYIVTIEDSYTNSVKTSALDKGISNISVDPNSTSLPEGTYRISVKEETVKAIGNYTNSAIIDDIQIAPNSTLNPGNVQLSIRRENTVDQFDGNSTGIKNVTITSENPALSPDDSFKLNIVSTPSNIEPADLSKKFITDLNINSTLFPSTGKEFQLMFEETGEESGKFQVSLIDKDGMTSLSDPVILDNNIQTYEFYSGGNKIGVSFNTISNVNTDLSSEVEASGKYNTFNIDKTIELVDKENNVLGSQKLTEHEPAGTIEISANGITYEIEHNGFDGIDINEFARFGIKSELLFSTDGFNENSTKFNPGETITLNGGIFVSTSSDISQYQSENEIAITVGTNLSYTATLTDDMDNAINGAPKIVVNDDKAYSFGDPANITFQTDDLTDGFTEFMVGKEATTNAILKTKEIEIDRLENIQADSNLSFHNGDLTMDIDSLTNGQATFTVTGGNIDNSIQIQIGANAGQTLNFGIKDMRSQA